MISYSSPLSYFITCEAESVSISKKRRDWWRRLWAELRHAFVLPSERPLTEKEKAWLATVAEKIARRRLGAPALFLLECLRPVHFVGSQALVFLSPVFKIAVPPQQYDGFVALLERPGAIDELVAQIEKTGIETESKGGPTRNNAPRN